MLEKARTSIVYKYVRQLVFQFRRAELTAMSAQITYYLILAFFPFLFFLINLLSFTSLPNRLLFTNFYALLPNDTAILVNNILQQTVQAKSKTLLLLGMIGSLWAISQGMCAVIRGLNLSYGVRETRSFIKLNLIALSATVGISVMISLTFFMIVLGRITGYYLFEHIGEKVLFQAIWPILRYGITLVFLFITFFLVYRYLPNRALKARNIVFGALFATLGWICSSLLFSFYVNNFANYEGVYGSLGGIFALIIWLNISARIILLGGEINALNSTFHSKDKQ